MVTPELISYMRGELAKGRTREEIRMELTKDGGWGEVDLSDAFRTVIPMQGSETVYTKVPSSNFLKLILIVLVIGVLGFAAWFYRDSMMGIFNNIVNLASYNKAKE